MFAKYSAGKKLLSSLVPSQITRCPLDAPPVVTLSGNVTLGCDWRGPMSVIGVTV